MDDKKVIKRRLLYLTIPIFIDSLLAILLGMMDTVMLSKYADNAVASVGVVNQVFNMVILVFQVTTLGTSVLCAQYYGAGKKEKLIQIVGVSLFFNLLLGLLLSFILYFRGEFLLRMMHLAPELMDDGLRYLRVVGGFAFIQSLSLTIAAVLRSTNKAKYPMFVTLVVNVVNAVGNYALIFGNFGLPEMGAEGAAVATTVSRAIALIILLVILVRTILPHFPRHLFFPFPFAELRKMLGIGMPAAGEQISYSLSQVVVTMFTNLIAIEAVVTRTYAMNIVMFSYLFALSISFGNSILIGQLIGEDRKEAAYQICLDSLKRALMITAVISGLIAASGAIIYGLLTDNQEIIRVGVIILCIDFVLEFGRTVNMMLVNALRSAGDARFPVMLGLFSMWVFATGLSWILGISMGYGLIGMWIAFTIDENFRAVILLKRWKSKKWMARDLLGEQQEAMTEATAS
ncbi:MAG: MATE family efflux transporter [Bacteroidales bacterium]